MFSKTALKIAFKNTHKRWIAITEQDKTDPNTAMARLRSDQFFSCNHKPKFTIANESKIYTIGSCFARNIERALTAANMDVLGMDFKVPEDVLLNTVGVMGNKVNDRSWLNKYSTHAIYSDLDGAINSKTYVDEGFICIGEDKWIDPQLAAVVQPATFKRLSELKSMVNAYTRQVLEADVVFITLGLNEVWKDSHTGAFLNSSPPPSLMRNDDSRFEFIIPTAAEAHATTAAAIELVRKNSTRNVKFILTVSPVPMGTTWTSDDVVVANSHSKSVLRSVAGQISAENTDVDYFPSYEMVTHSPRSLAWQDDQLHVSSEMVKHIVNIFSNSYFSTEI